IKLTISTGEITLVKEDLLIDTQQLEGYFSLSDGGVTVVLDTNLTPELEEEGFVRELISKIQTMRKDSGFEVMDHITVTLAGNEKLSALAERNKDTICHDVLAVSINSAASAEGKDWDINGEKVTIAVAKV
ncbi:MAG: isoleucine--tRNA ligase, partial [Ruminococcus sp.]|nr:isoleucine--tRNA ligase [Ruminococcus sp.]